MAEQWPQRDAGSKPWNPGRGLCGQSDLADVMKFRILKRKVIQDHPVIPKCNHSVLIGRRQAEGESIRGEGGKGWNDGL